MDNEELEEYEPTAGEVIADNIGTFNALIDILYSLSTSANHGVMTSGECFDFLARVLNDVKSELMPYAEI